jgi:hypothetical protein
MRIFLITLVTSTVASIALWQFGLAQRIWPAHPLLATTAIAMACGIAVQTVLRDDDARRKHETDQSKAPRPRNPSH